jgi:hypothetical protein
MQELINEQKPNTLAILGDRQNTTLYSIIAGFVCFVWFTVTTIVIPIKEMQIKLAQIDQKIAENSTEYSQIKSDHKMVGEQIVVLQEQVKNLIRNKK